MIGVFAKVSVRTGSIDPFEASARTLVETTRALDAGLKSYDFGRLIEEGTEGEYAFIERWESQEAFDAHTRTEHFTAAVTEWENYLSAPLEIYTYRF